MGRRMIGVYEIYSVGGALVIRKKKMHPNNPFIRRRGQNIDEGTNSYIDYTRSGPR